MFVVLIKQKQNKQNLKHKKASEGSFIARENLKFPGNKTPLPPRGTQCNTNQQLSMAADWQGNYVSWHLPRGDWRCLAWADGVGLGGGHKGVKGSLRWPEDASKWTGTAVCFSILRILNMQLVQSRSIKLVWQAVVSMNMCFSGAQIHVLNVLQ